MMGKGLSSLGTLRPQQLLLLCGQKGGGGVEGEWGSVLPLYFLCIHP